MRFMGKLTGVNIIALSGFRGSGKDTVAMMLEEALRDAGKQVSINSFADNIRDACNVIFGTNYTRTMSQEDKNVSDAFWSDVMKVEQFNYRDAMIGLGDILRQIWCPQIWNKGLERKLLNEVATYKPNPIKQMYCIVPDIRYEHEVRLLKRWQNKYMWNIRRICVLREDALPEWVKYGLSGKHKWEREIIVKDFKEVQSEYEWCFTDAKFQKCFINNGTKEELQQSVKDYVSKKILKK